MTSLAKAILANDRPQVNSMLRLGMSVNDPDEYGFTPLIEALISNNIELARLLIEHGADVNLQDETGQTPLHWAVETNNVALCKLLIEHGADPNGYSLAGQPVLVMPMLRKQSSLRKLLVDNGGKIDFAQDYINTKLLGHMFELVGTANIIDPNNNFVEVDFEGFYLEFSLAIISESISQYSRHFAAKQVRRYAQLAEVCVSVIERAAQLAKFQQYLVDENKHIPEINHLIEQEPLLMPVAYEGHAVTFVKLGDMLVHCDRREASRLYDNVVFYHVSKPNTFTTDFIRQLIYKKLPGEFINQQLHKVLGLSPMTELKIPAQISGNCSWANVEATIPVLFFMLFSNSPDFHKNMAQYKILVLNFFYQWREWNKERALDLCIKSFKEADSVRKGCKGEILAAILYQTCGEENPTNKARIEKILTVLNNPKYEYILKNYIKVYCYDDMSEEGKRFQTMLKKYGWLMH